MIMIMCTFYCLQLNSVHGDAIYDVIIKCEWYGVFGQMIMTSVLFSLGTVAAVCLAS